MLKDDFNAFKVSWLCEVFFNLSPGKVLIGSFVNYKSDWSLLQAGAQQRSEYKIFKAYTLLRIVSWINGVDLSWFVFKL